jgi:hypothetical protein
MNFTSFYAVLLTVWASIGLAQAVELPSPHMLKVDVRHAVSQAARVSTSSAMMLPKPHSLTVTIHHPSDITNASHSGALPLPVAHALSVKVSRKALKNVLHRKPVVKIVRVIQQSGVNPFNPQHPTTATAAITTPVNTTLGNTTPGTTTPGTTTPSTTACNATNNTFANLGIIFFLYNPSTGVCGFIPDSVGQPAVFDYSTTSNTISISGAFAPQPQWGLVSASGTGIIVTIPTPSVGKISNLPTDNSPVSFTIKCVNNCSGIGTGTTYSGQIRINSTISMSVQGLQ